jgi:hypothetical protein
MTTIELNNQNKTKFNFSYDNDLPYKKSIRPETKYGDWKENPKKALIKIFFSDLDYNLFKNPHKIKGLGTYICGDEIWFDLEDVYLIISLDSYLETKINEKNILLAFIYDNNVISSLGM